MKSYDIVIIGGGPAGATFAREVKKLCPSKSIALVDGMAEGSSKVCGGLLSPDAQKVMAQFDLTLPKELLARLQIFDVKTIDIPLGKERHYQRHYLNMTRGDFDRWLLSLIPEGVDIIRGICVAVGASEGTYWARLKGAEGESELSCRYLVGADGAASVVRRSFFKMPKRQYLAIQEHYPDKGEDMANYSCVFDPVTSKACSWMIRKNGRMIFGGAFEPKGCKEAFQRQRSRLEDHMKKSLGEPLFREACLVTAPLSLGDFVLGRDGVFLIGEAAGLISSSSFEGISSAFLSAKQLADSFCEDGADKILKSYRKKTIKLRLKLGLKILKMHVLFSPFLRRLILSSGICSIKKYKK